MDREALNVATNVFLLQVSGLLISSTVLRHCSPQEIKKRPMDVLATELRLLLVSRRGGGGGVGDSPKKRDWTLHVDSVAIEVSSRTKLTGIVRGKAFLHVLRRRPIGCPDSRKRTL
ncbi:hypothetical protein TNCV_1468321 [Trichonephila clavipes]|uniref:Uncharacterized protein n=1 Tax=Trichonephila clavipes TaxID=2585209 RepID=A0A8X6RVH7_TRICX|nr:hypothetical protein TNCV_1468321 [Trichonephila clavipes]